MGRYLALCGVGWFSFRQMTLRNKVRVKKGLSDKK